jgi:hypothetical protein
MVEDFAVFFALTEFATNASLGGVAVRGIFDNGYLQGDVGGNGMAGAQPMFTLATSHVPASPVGTSLVVNATNYRIAAHEPDGTGVSTLMLERTA